MTQLRSDVIVQQVALRPGVGAWFTGRTRASGGTDPVGAATGSGDGNLAHRRPHRPLDLARARDAVGRATGTSPAAWHLMHQIHGTTVGVVDERTPIGAELRGVDALVTALPERPLAVQVADCVPVLLAGPGTVAAVHAGRRGVLGGVIAAAVRELRRLEADGAELRAVIGPAIGGCCYEVPAPMQAEVAAAVPAAEARTTWGTPALDLPAAVVTQLQAAAVQVGDQVGGCTRCDPEQRWFSHRADPGSGRQIGLVTRSSPGSEPGGEGAAA